MSKTEETYRRQPLPDYEEVFEKLSSDDDAKKAPIKVLKEIYRGNWFKIFFNTAIHIADGCGDWVLPLATSNIINAVTYGKPNAMIVILLNFIAIALSVGINIPLLQLYTLLTGKMLRNIGAGLRNTLVKKLQHLSITYHKEIESGRLQAKFIRDIEAIEFFNSHIVKTIIPLIIHVTIYFCIALSKSGTVALFYLVVIPINVTLVTLFRKKVRKNSKRFREENENVSASVTTMIEMIPVTKAHGLENEEIAKLERNIQSLKVAGLAVERTNSLLASILYVIGVIMRSSCLVFTAWLALKGKIEVGDIVMFQSYFASISGTITTLVGVYPELAKGLESVRSVSEVMLSNEVEDNKGKIPLRYVHGSIDFEDVYFRYPNADEDTIKGVSLSVNPGDCVAFVGSSGCGKSTMINMIIGFLKPTGGVFKLDGKPIEALDLSKYRHFISVVPQNTVLFKGTIKENILYGVEGISDKRFEEILEAANINEFLPMLPDGINTVVGEHGDKLSGGQKQRISIARALIRDPQILILDEATSALDNASEFHVQKAIDTLIKGRTTFVVAHRLSTIRNANKIVVMDKGKIVEVGTYDELIAKEGKFYELKKLSEVSTSEE